jgi:hypothetical protein
MSAIPPRGQARPRHVVRSKPPFTVEMLEFEDTLAILPFPRGRLAEPSSTLGDAKLRGKHEASNCVVERGRRPGFRVLDATGRQVFCWRHGDDTL